MISSGASETLFDLGCLTTFGVLLWAAITAKAPYGNPYRPQIPATPIPLSERVQLRRKVASQLHALFPQSGCCGLCQWPWRVVNAHPTNYGDSGRAAYPLCEECWQELRTPDNRLPYYRALFDSWSQTEPQSEIKWADIEAAVRKEGTNAATNR